jgi:pilus assembly protein CpaF
MTAVYESLRRDALDRIQRNEVDPSDRSAVTTLVRHLVDGYQLAATSGSGRAPLHDPSSMVERLGRSILDFGPLTPFVDGTLVYEELIIHGDQVSYIDAEGRLVAHSDPISEDEVVHVVDKLLAAVGASVDEHRPMIQAQVLGGSGRLGVVVPPIADRIDVTLRRYLTKRETFDEMIGWDAISPAAATLLATMMRLPTGVLVTGQPGAGKTSLLNAMLRSAPSSLRVIACEDTPELSVDHLHAARWKTRAPGADGSGEVTLRDLVRLSLGMRPDLIVVGETRGGEAYELTRAGNAGCGLLSTIHANSARQGLQALVSTAVMAGPNVAVDQVRHVFSSIIDLVVSVAKEPVTATRDGSGGRRQVMEIASVPRLSGSEVEFSVEPIFLREDFGAPLCWTGTPLPHELSHRLDAVLRPLGLVAADVLEGRTSSLLSGVGGA